MRRIAKILLWQLIPYRYVRLFCLLAGLAMLCVGILLIYEGYHGLLFVLLGLGCVASSIPSTAASSRTKIVVKTIAFLCMLVIGCFVYGLFSAGRKYASEERFCGAFHPTIIAIHKFRESTGTLPTNLVQLVPSYVPQIPSAPLADSIDYNIMPDKTNWQITVHSHMLGEPLIFIQRSSYEFTDQERQQSVKGFHGWKVFKAQ